MQRWLVAGLGNPGPQYAGTRHNAGFMVVELLAGRLGGRFKSHKAGADVVEGHIELTSVVLMKSRTFMNSSGGPVAGVSRFFSVGADNLIVVHDELDLPFGSLRLKQGGGDGGHNGLKSITASLADKDYFRVRVGIGRPPGRQDPVDYVLRPFTATERKDLDFVVGRAADAVQAIIQTGLEQAQ